MEENEKDIKLNYQFAIFGAFPSMGFKNVETIAKMTQIFAKYGFIPSTTQDINVVEPGRVKVSSKISFNNNNDGIGFMLAPGRIDITFAFDKDNQTIYNASDEELIEKIMIYYKEITSNFDCQINRLGFNTADILSNYNSNKVIDKYNKMPKVAGFYNEKDPIEWNERIVIREENKKINEKINCITDISRASGRVQRLDKYIDFNGIVLNYDINTPIDNLEFRFKEDSVIKSFLEEAFRIKKEIEGTILN